MSDGEDGHESREEQEEHLERWAPRGQFPSASAMADFPTHAQLNAVAEPEGYVTATLYEPTGWWGSRDVARPWREKAELKRRASVPPEQSERWTRVKKRVSYAIRSTLGYSVEATHDLLEISADVLRFAPIPGLEEAARVLLTIWDALQLVETNRLACLRLTERCADILLSIREEIYEAGDQVGEELMIPMQKLVESFKSVHILLQKQVHRPFLKRYLKRDDILRSINGCDAALSDALSLFSVSIQIRTLRQLQAAEAQRKADTERLIASLTPPPSKVDPDATPKQKPVDLPQEPPPPPYITTSSKGTEASEDTSESKTSSTTSSSAAASEGAQSPPPTPDSQVLKIDASQVTLHAPPSPEEIRKQLGEIVTEQNAQDHALDLADLRALMRDALATSSDVEMLRVLQINRDDIAEAMKTLQRALEQEREKEEEVESRESVEAETAEEPPEANADTGGRPGSGALGLTGLRRRLTVDSVTTRASKKSKGSKRGAKGSRRSARADRDTLDREFIETGLDALRRLSRGQDINIPNWTITRYEVDMEAKIGIGYFSDVYRARWRNQTVAVKVLTLATPQRLFIHEMIVWKNLKHPNVLPLLGASSATGDPPWFLVSPFMKNGNLVDYMRSSKKLIDSVFERRAVYEIAKGMAYLHRRGVMHGDLKGTNVLIDDNGHCVLTDFGQSEMKSEAFRLSGNHPPRGTLRWRAPEIVDGTSSGKLTYQVDVYAFAIVCVEVFSHGALPWGVVDDDTYRHLVIEENKRPPISSTNASKSILAIIDMCWQRDPFNRPTFQKVVRELKKLGLSKYSDSPAMGGKAKLIEDDSKRKQSPDMRPVALPDMDDDPPVEGSGSARSSPGPSTLTNGAHTLSPQAIPIQRIITPIREEDKGFDSKGASPVEYRPIRLPESGPPSSEGLPEREMRPRSKSESAAAIHDESTSSSRTTSTNTATDRSADGPGIELERVESPPPADEGIAQRKNESRYRLCVQHKFHPSLILALWEPAPVELGAVGYLKRPQGKFVTLFNAFDPPRTSGGRADGMSNLYGYGKVERGSQRQDRRNMAQRGLDIIQGLLWFRSRTSGDYQRNVNRRVSFPIRAGHKSAYIYVEQTMYHYIADLTAPKVWFEANVDRILSLYATDHRLQKEDVFLVIGTLDTPDYGLFVNHNNPDGQVHFNVFASPRNGQKWGAFSIDLDSLPSDLAGGPSYHEEVPGKHASANKVSEVSAGQQWDTVLLARLRFRPDEDRPTAV